MKLVIIYSVYFPKSLYMRCNKKITVIFNFSKSIYLFIDNYLIPFKETPLSVLRALVSPTNSMKFNLIANYLGKSSAIFVDSQILCGICEYPL